MVNIKRETVINHNRAEVVVETRPAERQKVILVNEMILAFLPDMLNLELEEDGRIVITDEKGIYLGQIATKHIGKDWAL